MMRNRICFWSPCQSLLRTNHLKLDWLISFSSHQRSGWGCCSLFFVGWRFFLFLYPFCGRQLGQKELASGAPCFRQGVSAPSNLELVREGYLLQFDWLFFFPLLPCLFLNRVRKTGFLRPLLQLECAWMLSQSCRRLLRRGLQGTWGSSMTQDPTSGSEWSPQVISLLQIFWGFDTLASRIPSGGDNVWSQLLLLELARLLVACLLAVQFWLFWAHADMVFVRCIKRMTVCLGCW